MLWLKNRDGSSNLLKHYRASVPTLQNEILQTAVHPAGIGRVVPRAETLLASASTIHRWLKIVTTFLGARTSKPHTMKQSVMLTLPFACATSSPDIPLLKR